MIGTSLSFCVIDLVAGRVSVESVEVIFAGIYAPTRDDFLQVVEVYKETFWANWRGFDSEEAAKIAVLLYDEGKIIQPRLTGNSIPRNDSGYWLQGSSLSQDVV
jgi:hypothetical protein